MSGFISSSSSFCRMVDMCTSRCNGASLEENDQLGLNNCMDRCIYKYERTRKIVEQVLEQQGNTQPSSVSFKPTDYSIHNAFRAKEGRINDAS